MQYGHKKTPGNIYQVFLMISNQYPSNVIKPVEVVPVTVTWVVDVPVTTLVAIWLLATALGVNVKAVGNV